MTDLNSQARFTDGDRRMLTDFIWHRDPSTGAGQRIDVTAELEDRIFIQGGEFRVGALFRRDYMTTQGAARLLYFLNSTSYLGAMTGFSVQNGSLAPRDMYGTLLGEMEVETLLGPVRLQLGAGLDLSGNPDALPRFEPGPAIGSADLPGIWLNLDNGGVAAGVSNPVPFLEFLFTPRW